ncbi:Importin alpha subunit (Karyopherin alpha subunit) (Serine-rich RNA polymerase I suppressor protein) [Haplosporangium sp. Z 767]|nr:Importin alpha subunit (Karyopherin alpha subunit) (Serine-rich RNA polymerase I suppressor protein) [Haplosporangium sp. Z 11]KAF9191859.1 Importin alpha subunit (Karyopherin alpha subunit) (Serine-rich RNA polymerase I suppressor protein) [Haplosporangium sp. Z 767]
MLAVRPNASSKPRTVSQQKQKGSHANRNQSNDQDDEEDLIEQLNRKLSNVTLNPPSSIPDEMNITDISTMLPTFAQPLYNLLASGVYEQQLLAMVRIRKYLSLQDVLPRIDNVLALDSIHIFIAFLNMSEYPDLQYETAWVAGTTTQTQKLVDAGILAPLIHNLRVSTCVHVQTQTIWALGNISGDGPPYRDLILRSGALEIILQLIEMCDNTAVAKDQKYMILRIAVWCVSNLCRGSGRCAPEWLQVAPAFPMLRRLMYIDDTEILADTCEPHATIQVPSLRSLINIASGPEHHTQLLIDAMAIPILGSEELLAHRNSTIRRDALLGISNITAGTAEQVREVTVQDNGNVMRRVLEILRRGDIGGEDAGDDSLEGQEEGGDWRVLREAAWVVSNATSVLDLEITGHLVYHLDLLPSIAQLIDPRTSRKTSYLLPAIGLRNPALLTKLLDIVFNVLRCNEHHPKEQFMKLWVEDCEGGSILLELLRLSSPASESTPLRHLDSNKMLPRPLQHLRFSQHENDGLSAIGLKSNAQSLSPLGPSVKKRVETILENFFEFGPENDGFGPFFAERQPRHSGNRKQRDGYSSNFHGDDQDDDSDDDEYAEATQEDIYKNDYYGSGRGNLVRDTDIDIDDMEERVSRMNLV